jgi:UDP-GlcNAc:undecaprenyl-phosphate GlcNAc-1-phosphate transferase
VFLAVALAGALLGFRRYNAAPAKIYLGDTGSLLTGFLLASIAVVNDYTETTPVGALAPVLILGVPLFDTVFVMIVRRTKGIPVMRGSPDHLALRIRRAGWSTAATSRLGWTASAAVAAAGAALPSMSARWGWATFAVAAAVALAVGVAGGLTGRTRES